jgi:dolichol-phosphate mannosyltransferase
MTDTLISVVVPFLNEEENLPVLYERLCAMAKDRPESFAFVFVDDGSTDGSPAWAAAQARTDPRVRLIRLSRNFGHQVAITAGLDRARGDAVIIMDADLQDPPEVIPDLLAKWREGVEVVYAVRKSRAGETWLKKSLASLFYRLFRRLANVEVPPNAGDFRLIDRRVVEALREVRELHRFMRGLTCWVGFRQDAVFYERAARHAGVTKYPVWKSLRLAWDGLTSFSGAPLRWVSGLGYIVCVFGLVWLFGVIWGKLTNPGSQISGWASTMVAILLVGGIQLVSLGLIGQYLSRTYEESKKRPLYFVREDTGADSGHA